MRRTSSRYAILSVGDFPEGGATSQRLQMLAKVLNEGLGGMEIWILHPSSKTPIPENLAVRGEWSGIRFRYLSGKTVRPAGLLGALVDTIRGIVLATRLVVSRSTRPDVLVFYTPKFQKFIVPMLTARLLRVPVIAEVCEIYSHATDRTDPGLLRRLANRGEIWMERLLPKLSAGLLVISSRIRDYYARLGTPPDASYLLPVLVDVERYRAGSVPVMAALRDKRYLLNSGTFNEKDGLEYLVPAVATVRITHPDVQLVFTGDAPEPVRRTIREYGGEGASKWIVFTGLLTREQLVSCYHGAAGLLSCRSSSPYAQYGFPTKLAEYLASGRPVVATTAGDVPDYLVDEASAFLAESENIGSIADAIRKLLDDPVRADAVGWEGAAVARKWFDYRSYVVPVAGFIRGRVDGTG
jgi:glycosyltransferase involved in cell wall biosynthesis